VALTHDARKIRKAWAVHAASLTLAVVIGELSNVAHGQQIGVRTR